MVAARARDVLVKTSTPTTKVVRTCVVASALGVAIAWPTEVFAQVVDTPAHRIEFKVSPDLEKCNDYEAFYGILLNWVRVRSIDQTADPRLIVEIKRRPDGGKNVKLSLLDSSGAEVGEELHRYSPTEECFKVLYWTAWDSAKLLRSLVPVSPSVSEAKPPLTMDKPFEGREKPSESGESCPIYDPEFYSQSKPQAPPSPVPQTPDQSKHLVFGVGLTAGLTRAIMPTFRFGIGKSSGHLLVELNMHIMPPLVGSNSSSALGVEELVYTHGYLGNLAFCAHYSPLLGCLVASGGVAGYTDVGSNDDRQRFSEIGMGGAFLVGLRMGTQFVLNPKWSLRLDASVELPIYMADVLRPPTPQGQASFLPVITGFVSVVPHW